MSPGAPKGAFARAQYEQRRRRIRTRVRIAAVVAAVALLAGFAIYALYFSPWLVVRQVEVHGSHLLQTDDVRQAAAIAHDRPLASADLSGARARVSALPPVAEVDVSRSWPDTVVVEVTERQPVYERVVSEGFQWVDADGVGFHVAAERDESRILATTSQDDQRLLRDVATVVHWIPSDVVPDVVGLGATAVDHITLQLTDDREVVWGSAEQSELKSEVLGTLLQVEASVYDVSAPTYPTTR